MCVKSTSLSNYSEYWRGICYITVDFRIGKKCFKYSRPPDKVFENCCLFSMVFIQCFRVLSMLFHLMPCVVCGVSLASL